MDSERRHELQHNALDGELSKAWAFIQGHGNQIFWTIIIIATAILLVVFTRNKMYNRRLTETQEYAVACEPANPMPPFDWRMVDWREVNWNNLRGCYPFKGMMAGALLTQDNSDRMQAGLAPVPMTYAQVQEMAYGGDLPGIEAEINQLIDFADSAHNDRLAGMALVTAGDLRLIQYSLSMTQESSVLDAAQELYQQAATEYADDGLVVGNAQLGLAKVAENRWAFDAAAGAYDAVEAAPGSQGTPAALAARVGQGQLDSLRRAAPLQSTARGSSEADAPLLPEGDSAWEPEIPMDFAPSADE
jgi:hypothetical protein